VTPNNPMQRAVLDKVHGRGRLSVELVQDKHARVLIHWRTGADGNR
jgi:hypothetical protein